MLRPEGIIAAMITPFTSSQEVDFAALDTIVEHLVSAGVHGIFALGTNGEFVSLEQQEKLDVAAAVVRAARGRVPVYAGTGGINTKQTGDFSKAMEQVGVDGLSVITPYFLPFSQEEIEAHFRTVAEAVSLPILVYNIPSRTGVQLEPQTLARLAGVPNIVGIKDSSGDLQNVIEYIEATDEDFSVLVGTDSLICFALVAGARGAVAATTNIAPHLSVGIYEAWRAGRVDDAYELQRRLGVVRAGIGRHGTIPASLKATMELLGLPAGPPRAPVVALDDEQRSELETIVDLCRAPSRHGSMVGEGGETM